MSFFAFGSGSGSPGLSQAFLRCVVDLFALAAHSRCASVSFVCSLCSSRIANSKHLHAVAVFVASNPVSFCFYCPDGLTQLLVPRPPLGDLSSASAPGDVVCCTKRRPPCLILPEHPSTLELMLVGGVYGGCVTCLLSAERMFEGVAAQRLKAQAVCDARELALAQVFPPRSSASWLACFAPFAHASPRQPDIALPVNQKNPC